eukprot:TRINITY_DN14052_c1_g1_i1.p2 TRINITY_DN14052_c1_g1~~TRINITY_DN14052_c1_g1_i1.p2  ORF type:complete len:217 (+),score=62.00 TRINITY_DN14052_c1_g1_i1:156-806(+)
MADYDCDVRDFVTDVGGDSGALANYSAEAAPRHSPMGMDLKAELETAQWAEQGDKAAEAQMMAAAMSGLDVAGDGDTLADYSAMSSAAKRCAMAFGGQMTTGQKPLTPPDRTLDTPEMWEHLASTTVESQASHTASVPQQARAEAGAASADGGFMQMMSATPGMLRNLTADTTAMFKAASKTSAALRKASSRAYQDTAAHAPPPVEPSPVTRINMI